MLKMQERFRHSFVGWEAQPNNCLLERNLGNWVLIPRHPIGIVHFLWVFFVAAAPQLTYRWLLGMGYAVATPGTSFEHAVIAQSVLQSFESAIAHHATGVFRKRYLPIYGLAWAANLHLLIGSLSQNEQAIS